MIFFLNPNIAVSDPAIKHVLDGLRQRDMYCRSYEYTGGYDENDKFLGDGHRVTLTRSNMLTRENINDPACIVDINPMKVILTIKKNIKSNSEIISEYTFERLFSDPGYALVTYNEEGEIEHIEGPLCYIDKFIKGELAKEE